MIDLEKAGTDAAQWAEAFVKTMRAQPDADVSREKPEALFDPTPGGLLHSWFCNAIERGRSAGYAEAMKEQE